LAQARAKPYLVQRPSNKTLEWAVGDSHVAIQRTPCAVFKLSRLLVVLLPLLLLFFVNVCKRFHR